MKMRNMNSDFEFVLSENNDIVFRLDKYNENLFEIAKLKNDDESYAYNAVRFEFDKIEELHDLLELGLNTPKAELPIITTRINGTQVRILNRFGIFDTKHKLYQFTYTDWGGSEKYDFHPWYKNYAECDKGVRLTEDECRNLLTALKLWLICKNKG